MSTDLTAMRASHSRFENTANQDVEARAFSSHRHECPMLFTFLALMLIELPLAHFLISLWSESVAWALTIFGIAALTHLLWSIYSVYARPMLIRKAGLQLRAGCQIELFLPFCHIDGIEYFGWRKDSAPGMYRATVLSYPNLLIRLNKPINVGKLRGTRQVDCVAIRLDDADTFIAEFDTRKKLV